MSRRPDPELNPLTVRCDESAAVDAWQGARIGHRTREAHGRARSASIDELGPAGLPRLTAVLMSVVVLATLIEFQLFGTAPSARELAEHGGMSAFAFAQGDWWAVITSNLFHVGFTHLLLNLFGLALMGRWVELVSGRWAMLAIVLTSAIGASIGAVVLDPRVPSVGASGIVFGLLTAAFVLDPKARTTMGATARGLLVLNVIGTFVVPGISIGGHAGGLVGGGLAALLCWSRRPVADGDVTSVPAAIRALGHTRRAAALIVAVVSAGVLLWCGAWQALDASSAGEVGQRLAIRLVELEQG